MTIVRSVKTKEKAILGQHFLPMVVIENLKTETLDKSKSLRLRVKGGIGIHP